LSSVGNRIRQLREERGLTQEQLGKILNVQKAAISKYEKGRTLPDSESLKKLAKFFNVSADYLLCLTDTREPTPADNEMTRNLSRQNDEKSLAKIADEFVSSLKYIFTDNRGIAPPEFLLATLLAIPSILLVMINKLSNVAGGKNEHLLTDFEKALRETMYSILMNDTIDISDLDDEMKEDARKYIEWLRTKQKLTPSQDEMSAGSEVLDKPKAQGE